VGKGQGGRKGLRIKKKKTTIDRPKKRRNDRNWKRPHPGMLRRKGKGGGTGEKGKGNTKKDKPVNWFKLAKTEELKLNRAHLDKHGRRGKKTPGKGEPERNVRGGGFRDWRPLTVWRFLPRLNKEEAVRGEQGGGGGGKWQRVEREKGKKKQPRSKKGGVKRLNAGRMKSQKGREKKAKGEVLGEASGRDAT